jgi:DNA-binding NtrC family response regulator
LVLIVDDEPLIADETSIGLELEGYDTLIAESASEAFGVLAFRSDIGVLLSDVRMPGIDGITLANQVLVGRENHDALSVILMTGHAEDVPPKGVAACIAKPFSMSALVDLVARAMSDVAAKRSSAQNEKEVTLLLI